MGILWTILSTGHYFVLEGVAQRVMLTVSLSTTVLMYGLWIKMKFRGLFPDSLSHLVATVIVFSLGCNSIVHIFVTADPKQSTNVGILLVSVGCFFMSLRWFFGVQTVLLVAWVVVMSQIADAEAWIHFGFMNVIATALSIMVIRSHRRLVVQAHREYMAQVALAEEMQAQSKTDPLTGLPNRRAFDETIELEWQRSLRSRGKISVLLIDVDYFKAYNDTYGHLEGDECLTRIATILRSEFKRSIDFIGRYGGEEFVAVLPEVSEAEALDLAERCRHAVEHAKIPHGATPAGEGGHVSISVGVASAVATRDTSPAELIEAADKGLYAAKEDGRNRVVAA